MTHSETGKTPRPFDGEIEVLDRQVTHDGFFRMVTYRVRHSLFSGGWSPVQQREIFERGHAAAIVLYDDRRDAVVMIEQFRLAAAIAGMHPWLLEIVAGIIEEGEDAEEVVRREALEEAGCSVQEIERVGRFLTSQGGSSETLTLFCGRIDSSGIDGLHGRAEEGEDIRAMALPWATAERMLIAGEISNFTCLSGLQWLALNRDRLRSVWQGKPAS